MNLRLHHSRIANGITAEQTGRGHFFIALYLCLMLLLTVYQDFPLVNIIGEIGRTPIILMLPIFICCEIAMFAKYKTIMYGTKLQKYIAGFIVYIWLISVLYIFIHFLQGSYTFGPENLLGKSLKVILYFFLILLYIRHMQLLFLKIKSYRLLYGCFFIVVTLLVFIMIVEFVSIPNALTFMHAGNNPYWRVRLLTSESSTTGSIVVVYATILIYLTQYLKGFRKTLSYSYAIAFFLFYLFVTGSKGFLIVLLLTLVITILRFLNFRKKRDFFLLILFVIATYFFISYFSEGLLNSLLNDMENYTSSYTRLGMIIISVITITHHPLGVGTGAYLLYFEKYMDYSITLMSGFYYNVFGMSQINTGELLQYTQSDKNLGIKSGFFQWVMFGGVFSCAFFFLITRYLFIKVKSNSILFVGLVYILFSLLFVTLEIKYEIWLLFSFISFFLGQNDTRQSNVREVAK